MKFKERYWCFVVFLGFSISVEAAPANESFEYSSQFTQLPDTLSKEVNGVPSVDEAYNEALEMLKNGQLMEAYRLFENIVVVNKEHHPSFYQMALIAYQFGALDVADNAISNALLIKPTESSYWVFNYEVNRRLQSKEKMIIAMDNVLKLKPQEPELVAQIIFDYYLHNEKEKSQEALEYGKKEFGDNVSILLSQARVLNNEQLYDEAEILLKQIIQVDPKISDSYILLSEIYRKQRKYKEGLNILENAQNALGESNALIEFSKADIYREQKKKKLSLEHLAKGLKSPDLDFQNQSSVLANSLSFYKFKDLEAIFNDYLERFKEDPYAYLVVGDLYLENKQDEKAVSLYRESLKLNPENPDVWNMVLTYSIYKDDFSTMRKDGEAALKALPNNPNIHLLVGSAYFMDKNLEKVERSERAREIVEKALDLESANSEESVLLGNIYAFLGDIYNNLGMYAASNIAYDESLKIDSTNVSTLNNYAYYLSLRKENLEKALKFSGKTIEFDEENPTFLDTYGWVLYQMEKYTEAKYYLEKALKLSSDPSADILHHYGDVLFQLNEVKSAVKYWKKALKLTSNSEEEHENLMNKVQNKSIK